MDLMTTSQVAKRLGVEEETLINWRYKGRTDLPFVRVGRLVRYRPEDVEQFIERNTEGVA